MAEPAVKPMSLAEFLRWDDGSDTHYELIGGFPLAMAPPAAAHRMPSSLPDLRPSFPDIRFG